MIKHSKTLVYVVSICESFASESDSSSAVSNQSTIRFIWSRKILLPLAKWASWYHLKIACSVITSSVHRVNWTMQHKFQTFQFELTVVEEINNLVKSFCQVSIVMAVVLNLDQ